MKIRVFVLKKNGKNTDAVKDVTFSNPSFLKKMGLESSVDSIYEKMVKTDDLVWKKGVALKKDDFLMIFIDSITAQNFKMDGLVNEGLVAKAMASTPVINLK